jgi:hypothetical protein
MGLAYCQAQPWLGLAIGYTQTLYQRLYALKQEGKSVNKYTDDFYELVARNNLVKTKE